MGRYRGGGYQGTRYRGSRGSGRAAAVAVPLVLAMLALGLWFGRGFLSPSSGVQVTPEPAPAATPTLEPTPTPPTMREKPEAVKGVYVSGPVAGDPYMDNIIELIDSTELNTVVIDIKNDEGELTYRSAEGSTAREIGACVRYISDLPALVERLKEHGIYTIARVVAFKDPILAGAKPELMLKKADGTGVAGSGALYWVNPFEQGVRDYLIEIALDAVDAGFDEVQMDYVRFPSGKGTGDLDFGPSAEGKERSDGVTEFLEELDLALQERGVWLSADVFGVVITNRSDGAFLGQDYARMGGTVDFISPMIYPSHYTNGAFNLDVPDAHPYETVLGALTASQQVLSGVDEETRAGVRPWLQAFTATWVKGHISYGGEEIRAQIQATYDAGYTEWILWNAQNRYSADGLLPAEE